jgi:hypothetical protein
MIDHLAFTPVPAWRDLRDEARARLFARADAALGYRWLRRRFATRVGYPLDLDPPRSAAEKIQWRKLRDRNRLFPVLADKLGVRGFVAERLGAAQAARLFPRLLAVADRPGRLDVAALPGDVVIKAAHASGWMVILREGDPVDPERLRALCDHWLRRSYDPFKQEWAYRRVPRRVIVEELCTLSDGSVPDDIKLHVYDGVVRRCQVETARETEPRARSYARDWGPSESANVAGVVHDVLAPERERPARLDEMIAVAERLAAGFDYLRVDFLDLGETFLMTEITLYPASGFVGSKDYSTDVEVGRHWRNPAWEAAEAQRAPLPVARGGRAG